MTQQPHRLWRLGWDQWIAGGMGLALVAQLVFLWQAPVVSIEGFPKSMDETQRATLPVLNPVQQTPMVAQASQKHRTRPPVNRPKLSLNEASAQELIQLPGVGPKTAQAILAYRKEHGPFQAVDHLIRVKGIGPKTLSRLKPWLVLKAVATTGAE